MGKKLGVEIEFTGVTRLEVVTALEKFFKTKARAVTSSALDEPYQYYEIRDCNNEKWLVVRDRSIKAERFVDNSFEIETIADTTYMCELVSPPLTGKSLHLLFSIVDIIKGLGGITNSSCGIHVHVDKPDNLSSIVSVLGRFISEQEDIVRKFGVDDRRLERYCKLYNASALDLNGYFGSEEDFIAYLKSCLLSEEDEPKQLRYYALNMWSLLHHGTIEFRLFNSTLSKSEIAGILNWVLHFMYTADDYDSYIPILSAIMVSEFQKGA